MKIYVFDERTGGSVRDLCMSNRAQVLTHEEAISRRKHTKLGLSFLDEVDLLILEITKPTQDLQFILAHALLLQKPTLCLYAKNQPPRDVMNYIRKQPRPCSVKTFSYTADTLGLATRRFMSQYRVESDEGEDQALIKYTLRLTSHDDRYIQWLAKMNRTTKAKMLRRIIQDMVESDEDYCATLE